MTRRWWLPALPVAALLAWAALAPLPAGPREQVFDIPAGTWARHMAGERSDVLPQTIYLTLGLRDVLVVRNSDRVPQTVGSILIMPGQSFRLPFATPSENQFDCTAHSSGQLTVLVAPWPAPGWQRLFWRLRRAAHQLLPT